jgi:hypothetical protein
VVPAGWAVELAVRVDIDHRAAELDIDQAALDIDRDPLALARDAEPRPDHAYRRVAGAHDELGALLARRDGEPRRAALEQHGGVTGLVVHHDGGIGVELDVRVAERDRRRRGARDDARRLVAGDNVMAGRTRAEPPAPGPRRGRAGVRKLGRCVDPRPQATLDARPRGLGQLLDGRWPETFVVGHDSPP